MQIWFPTLNDALMAEGLIDHWPLGLNVQYDQVVQFAAKGKWIVVYRDNAGRYERPIHYATKMADMY